MQDWNTSFVWSRINVAAIHEKTATRRKGNRTGWEIDKIAKRRENKRRIQGQKKGPGDTGDGRDRGVGPIIDMGDKKQGSRKLETGR